MEYIAMRAFLKTGKDDILTSHKQQFIALFPEWSERFFKFETLIASIVDGIKLKYKHLVKLAGEKQVKPSGEKQVKPSGEKQENMDKLVTNLHKMIKKDYGNITKDYDNIIRNYIINPEYTLIYMHLLNLK
jgi:hypothetical protein